MSNRDKGPAPDKLIEGHRYDGIQEYDNPMPRWWTGIFWATIVFSVIYYLGIHVFDLIDTYEEDLAESIQELDAVRASYAAEQPSFEADEKGLSAALADPAAAERGKAHFAAYCVACHGDAGQGSIGPNLADDYWLHGGSNTELFAVISAGVLEKGMPGWEATLKPNERADVVAYIRSINDSNPPGAKEPQGELVE